MLFDWLTGFSSWLLSLYCFRGWYFVLYCFSGWLLSLYCFRGSYLVFVLFQWLMSSFVLFQGLTCWSVILPWPRTCGWFYYTRAGWVRSLTPRTSSIRPRRKPGQITIFVWIRFSLETSVSENIRWFFPFEIWNILKHFAPFAQQCIPFVSF